MKENNTDKLQLLTAKTNFTFWKTPNKNINKNKILPIGIDIGYSQTKIWGLHGKHIFPSLAVMANTEGNVIKNNNSIRYRNEYGEVCFVGDLDKSVNASDMSKIDDDMMFTKKRIRTEEYLILFRIAVYFGMQKKDGHLDDKKDIYISTGLPVDQLELNTGRIKEKFSGMHSFEVSVGGGDWEKVAFKTTKDMITVLAQPYGAVFSMIFDEDQNIVNESIASLSEFMVVDGGYFSIDVYNVIAGTKGNNSTIEDYTMYKNHTSLVKKLHEVSNDINIETYEIDKYLNNYGGNVKYGQDNQIYNFNNDLKKIISNSADRLLTRLKNKYEDFNNIDALICAGGTCISYYDHFKENLNNVTVLKAEGPGFDPVFANVVGFFNYAVATCYREDKMFKNLEDVVEIKETE